MAVLAAGVLVMGAAPRAFGADLGGGERAASGAREPRPIRVGPLVGVGFPRPFALEAFGKFGDVVGAGVEYSFLPAMSVSGVDASFWALAGDVRLFPFKNGWFIGARVGRQWLDARTRIDAGRFGSFTESMAAETWFLNPRVGILHTFGSGITVGVDAGVQFPIEPRYVRSGRATDAGLTAGTSVDEALVVAADTLGNGPTVTVDLLRLGFLF